MASHDWNQSYEAGELPWETGRPEPLLIELVRTVTPGRALEIGAGTGTNARWLAEQGFDVLGVDIAPRAIEMARAAVTARHAARCRFEVNDFLAEPPAGPFAFVFDRGCFHSIDGLDDRIRFARHVARVLAPDGLWLSLIGSTEGPPRDFGPPRLSAVDVTAAIEPALAIHELAAVHFDQGSPPWAAWRCVARRRS
jgi:SAM-dependent methyltransferase